MVSIGEILKEKRLELGFSLDEMSVKTKLSKIQLKAIEEGNISFFKDDLSYLTYFVRYYANALGINYNDIRNDLDETITGFTNTLSISKINEMERIEEGVSAKRKQSVTKGPKRASKVANVDLASLAMIVLAIAILLGLGFVFVKVIIPSFKGGNDPIVSRPIPPNVEEKPGTEEKPGDQEKPGDEEKPGEGEKPENPGTGEEETPETPDENPGESTDYTVTKVDARSYDISGWHPNEDFVFEVILNTSTTLRFTLDGAVQTTPESGVVYNSGEVIPFTTKAEDGKVLEISIGYPQNNQMKINGQDLELDPSVTGSKSATTVSFRFIGE